MDPITIVLIVLFTLLAIAVFALSFLAFSDKAFLGGIGLVLFGLIFVFLIVLELLFWS